MTYSSPIACSRCSGVSQSGFTLVEILVGLAIGMLATIVIMQVFSVFETQKRTTTGLADAQTNGSIALFNIEREMQQAGYAVMPTGATESPYQCPTLFISGVADTTTPNRLSPVVITDTGAVDSVVIRYGDSAFGGAPITITGMTNATTVGVASNFGCQFNDATLISPLYHGSACAMSIVTALPASGVTLANGTGAAAKYNLACLGAWHEVTFRVHNSNLERQDLAISTDWVPSVAGVVDLQAQYGISLVPTTNDVIQWVDATGAWAAPSFSDRNRIKAIRLAIVALNEKYEPGIVTDTCSSQTASAPTGLCAWAGNASSPAPSITLADPNWQHYRYRVFETVIPIRNIIWSRAAL